MNVKRRFLSALPRRLALLLLLALLAAALLAGRIAPARYDEQFRDYPNARPCARFPLGTDELGRDRLSRLLYGSRVSLLLAPAAAALATITALAIGLTAGYGGCLAESAALGFTDLVVSIPSLLLLFIARAMLPLNITPMVSVGFTFLLLAILGWTSGVRVILAAVVQARDSEYVRQARALGCRPCTILFRHTAAAVRPIAAGQFWILVPLFLVSEANLGMLGLGVTEPLPSWGNLLAEMQTAASLTDAPWLLAPAVLLVVVLLSLQNVLQSGEMH